MLDIIITSRTRRKILALFCLNPDRSFYLRQIAREIGEGVNATRQELAYLESKGALLSIREGKQRFFSLNDGLPDLDKLQEMVRSAVGRGHAEFRFTNFDRKEKLEKNLSRVVTSLRLNYRPEKIILFGSLAEGKIGPWSDIDLFIIKATDKDYFDRLREVVRLCDYNVGIDFFIWTPEEFAQRGKMSSFIKEEVLKKGKVIYERKG